MAHLRRREWRQAHGLFKQALDADPGTAARLRLGDVLVALHRDEPGRKAFDAALAGAERLGARQLAKQAADAPSAPPYVVSGFSRTAPSDVVSGWSRTPSSSLTAREVEVLALVAQDISNQEIGDRLFISAFTVKRHIANILPMFDLPTRAAAAADAIRKGLAR